MMRIELPWPDPILSPNARAHWVPRAKAKAVARQVAHVVTLAAILPARWFAPPDGPVPLTVTFCPPTKHMYDIDNRIASCKAAFDGMADAMQIDDSRFEFTFRRGDVVKGGIVVVEL